MNRLLSFYGDDFTGSTDVMEALASHGVETVLFTRLPSPQEFAPFAEYQAAGLAGISRSQPPAWMDEHLPAAFAWLKSLNAQYCHYKVCSTFDSSPRIGSIGRAIDIGLRVFQQERAALIVGAPQLKRYTFAGHLFAAYQGRVYRIDRHPVMSRHPVTPMDESDLLLHLARQSPAAVDLIDVHDAATQLAAGQVLLDLPPAARPFVVGSSGVEYALLAALRARAQIVRAAVFAPLAALPRMVVVSGSVSPTTERQIGFALQHGFDAVPVDAVALARRDAGARHSAIVAALRVLSAGRSPLVHTALGPASDVGAQVENIADGRKHIGEGLGGILKALLEETGLRRAIVAGGDSSSHALGQLDIFALTTRMPLPATPGSPVCTAASANPSLNGLEIALKGGQVGGDDYFVALRDGRVAS